MVNTSTDYKNNKESLIKDIAEREKIISDYKKYGVLDRDKAINKIQELRIKDKEVEEITIAKLATFSIPFSRYFVGWFCSEQPHLLLRV